MLWLYAIFPLLVKQQKTTLCLNKQHAQIATLNSTGDTNHPTKNIVGARCGAAIIPPIVSAVGRATRRAILKIITFKKTREVGDLSRYPHGESCAGRQGTLG